MQHDLLTYIKKLSSASFQLLQSTEELAFNLHSEVSDFIRFNHSKVRQNTTVQQHELTVQYQKDLRSYKIKFNLTLNFDHDLNKIKKTVEQLRIDLPNTDVSPTFVPMTNNGSSETFKKSQRPTTAEIIAIIGSTFSDADLAGLWCSGPLRQASINSKGQFHYFETDYFFFDYSIYDGPRAAKAFYADDNWNLKNFTDGAQEAKNTLALLKKPSLKIQPGQYKTYLGPMAVAEIVGLFNWRALSQASYKQGFAPLKKLVEKELSMSPKFTLVENLNLGYSTPFNSIGEVGPKELPLIEKGQLTNFLTSTATANEYKLKSNFAEIGETMRSPEIRAGALKEQDALKELGTGLYLSNLHYINWSDVQTARLTGMTRFACFWVQNGEIQGPIQDMRFDDSLFNLFGKNVIDFTETQHVYTSTSTYLKRDLGAMKVPGLLLQGMNFTL